MDIVSETDKGGLVERRFDLKVGDEVVPGVVWTPEGATGARPKVLFGHGGTQHKKVAHIPSFARRLAAHGWASVAIDAPDHGDRVPEHERALEPTERLARVRDRMNTLTGAERKARAQMAVAEWQATIDAVEQLDNVGDGPTGYWGVSMGTMFGVPLIAVEKRVRCAVLGLMGGRLGGGNRYLEAAGQITIPLQFMLQQGDELVPVESGIELFDTFGSEEKMLAMNPGAHAAVPPYMFDINQQFFQRHLS
jgi:dienelactone hydrolase